jgi:hypothetical protein
MAILKYSSITVVSCHSRQNIAYDSRTGVLQILFDAGLVVSLFCFVLEDLLQILEGWMVLVFHM